MRTPMIRPLLVTVILWVASFSLASLIFERTAVAAGTTGRAVATPFFLRLLGGSRAALGERLFLKADNVFHRGVSPPPERAFSGRICALHDAIAPRIQEHLQPGELQEVLPWLFLSVRMDPDNVMAYVVSAFWLSEQIGRPDLALELMREAHQHHPRDYRIFLEQGRLRLRLGHLRAAAAALDAGLRLWPHPHTADDDDALLDAAQMKMYRALLAEIQGETAVAMELYSDILAVFPGRIGARARLEALRHGESPQPPAERLMDNMLAHNRYICQHHHECVPDQHHQHNEAAGHLHD
ncbi:MAG: hypothetical protein ACOYCD_01945 [Kiritimatiellia bacterium]|jgi:tetratricopeptide (TPR) repeat protein